MRHVRVESVEARRLLASGIAAQTLLPVRINAGGSAIVDDLARPFATDRGFVGGTLLDTTRESFPSGTTSADARVGGDFAFSHPLPRGTYTVMIQVADPTSTAAGQRVFDVFAEGSLAIDNLDARAHYRPNTATDIQYHGMWFAATVSVQDGQLNLRFVGEVGEALVSAITIYSNQTPRDVLRYEQTARTANGKPYEAAINVQDASRLREIGFGLMLFANGHRNLLPWSWQDMADEMPPEAIHSASAWRTHASPRGLLSEGEAAAFGAARDDFVIVAWKKRYRDVQAETLMGYRNLSLPGNEIPVLRGDGSVQLMTCAALLAELGTTQPRIDKNLGELSPLPADPNMTLIRSRLNTLAQAIQQYSQSNSGNFPVTLGQLYARNFLRDVNIYLNPRFPTEVPTGLTVDEMAAWIDQNAGYRYNRVTRQGTYRDNVVTVFEDPQRVRGPVWMVTTYAPVRLYEPMWANELLRRTQPYLWPTTPALVAEPAKVRVRADRAIAADVLN